MNSLFNSKTLVVHVSLKNTDFNQENLLIHLIEKKLFLYISAIFLLSLNSFLLQIIDTYKWILQSLNVYLEIAMKGSIILPILSQKPHRNFFPFFIFVFILEIMTKLNFMEKKSFHAITLGGLSLWQFEI